MTISTSILVLFYDFLYELFESMILKHLDILRNPVETLSEENTQILQAVEDPTFSG